MSIDVLKYNSDFIGSCGKQERNSNSKPHAYGSTGYGHHETGDSGCNLIIDPSLVNKLSTGLICKGINTNNLTPLVCACLFRNHIFKHLMMNKYHDPNKYDLDIEIFKSVCHLRKTLDCPKTTLRFLTRLNDLTFPIGCKLVDCDWNLIKKRIKLSSFDIKVIWLGDNDAKMDSMKIGILIDVYQSMKCRKMIAKKYTQKQIEEYFEKMTSDQKVRKIFMIALDCWVNACDGLDNVMPLHINLACLGYNTMCKALDGVFKHENPEFWTIEVRPLTYNESKYTPKERGQLNKWLCNPANVSPTMAVIIAIIQCVSTGSWCDFYGKMDGASNHNC